MKIKHVLVPPRLVAELPLMSMQTLMINCPGRLSGAAFKKVRRFVKTGGYLVTTDWALTMLARAFPGYVKQGKKVKVRDLFGNEGWVDPSELEQNNCDIIHKMISRVPPYWSL